MEKFQGEGIYTLTIFQIFSISLFCNFLKRVKCVYLPSLLLSTHLCGKHQWDIKSKLCQVILAWEIFWFFPRKEFEMFLLFSVYFVKFSHFCNNDYEYEWRFSCFYILQIFVNYQKSQHFQQAKITWNPLCSLSYEFRYFQISWQNEP